MIMNPCIGIVSYLPDNEFREVRYNNCKKLLSQLNSIFNIQIIIIEQNYRDLALNERNLIEYKFDEKLGIAKARRTLRQKFLESDFDYIILFDDDGYVEGTYEEGQDFLKQLYRHPNTFFSQKNALFCGMCISRKLFEIVDIPNLEAGKNEGYEDNAFFTIINHVCWVKDKVMKTNLKFTHSFACSTWMRYEICKDNQLRSENTEKYVKNELEKFDKLPMLFD